MKVFLSVPMGLKTDEQIENELKAAKHYFLATDWPGKNTAEFVHNYVPGGQPPYNLTRREQREIRVKYLSEAIAKMADCDLVVFYPNWKHHEGCSIEHLVCMAYNINILEMG